MLRCWKCELPMDPAEENEINVGSGVVRYVCDFCHRLYPKTLIPVVLVTQAWDLGPQRRLWADLQDSSGQRMATSTFSRN